MKYNKNERKSKPKTKHTKQKYKGCFMDLDINERKKKILDILYKDGSVKVNDLSRMFNVSEVTIRLDLSDLEKKGMLSRVHGGAVSSYKNYFNMDLNQRINTNAAHKQNIAKKIASMIGDNETIMMNSGTTTLYTLRALQNHRNLNIVTNSIAIALEAAGRPNINVILLGGSVNTKYQYTYGNDALNQLEKYYADKLILSVDGVSVDTGFSTYYQQEAQICRVMTEHVNTSIVGADYTKIGRTAFTKIAPLDVIDHIVTNENAPGAEIENLRSKEINVILV
jgi:DeoR/GlpR family transcriptional regulator of sugar metabolism